MAPKIKEKKNQTPPEWRIRFIEVCVRAIRTIHNDFLIWSFGRPGIKASPSFRNYNIGHGFELADELSVCSAITQEALRSPLLMDHKKYYSIDREVAYNNGKNQHVDIVIQRCILENKKVKIRRERTFIEAKRARNVVASLSTGEIDYRSPNYNDVVCDIFKLIDFNPPDKILRYNLIWGESSIDPKDPLSPNNYFSEVTKRFKGHSAYVSGNLKLMTTRIFPIKWSGDNLNDFIVEKVGWVMLIQIIKR